MKCSLKKKKKRGGEGKLNITDFIECLYSNILHKQTCHFNQIKPTREGGNYLCYFLTAIKS